MEMQPMAQAGEMNAGPQAMEPDVLVIGGALQKVLSGRDLDAALSESLFGALVAGQLSDIEISALATALKVKGECAAEIVGAARALRRAALEFPTPDYPFADSCGTGGDGADTVNVSTAAAFVAAACGMPVAKHGNRSVSSRCGSLDLLEAVGVRIDAAPEVSRRCLDQVGLCVLDARQYHSGIRHAMPVRQALATRTIFNVLGPLVNPAAPTCQLLGVYDPKLCRPMAEALRQLGCRSALVVHGCGLDEIAMHGATQAVLLRDGELLDQTIAPEQAGLTRAPLEALKGGGPSDNARWFTAILQGDGPPAHLDAIALNAGALLWLADVAGDLRDGVARARAALAAGEPFLILERLIELSHGA
ncbi:MAG: anthranilate phosphoribosyltransferase [Sphingomonadales bacterium]